MIRFTCWWNFTYWQLRKWAAEHTHTGVIQQLHYSFGNSQLTFKFVVRATVPVRHPGNNSYVGRTNITRKKMEKKKKKSNVHISGFSLVIFSQHTYNRSCSPDTDIEDNQEPYDAMFLRSIYQSYSIDPAANMPEPRLPGHNRQVHCKASRDSTSSGMPYRSGQI